MHLGPGDSRNSKKSTERRPGDARPGPGPVSTMDRKTSSDQKLPDGCELSPEISADEEIQLTDGPGDA